MSEPSFANLLSVRCYESADPATLAELARNERIAALDRLIAEKADEKQPATVLPLRANGCR